MYWRKQSPRPQRTKEAQRRPLTDSSHVILRPCSREKLVSKVALLGASVAVPWSWYERALR